MSVTVLDRPTATETARKDCLAVLGELRRQVEEGEISGLFVLSNTIANEWKDIWAGETPMTTTIIGRLEIAKADLIARYLSQK